MTMKTDPLENTPEGKPAFKQTHNLPESGGDTLFVGSRAVERNAREGQKHTVPRTDAFAVGLHDADLSWYDKFAATLDFARELETENAELLAQRDALLALVERIQWLAWAGEAEREAGGVPYQITPGDWIRLIKQATAIDATKAKGAE